MKRGFEVVSKYKDRRVKLPVRMTKNAAGYDFFAAEDFLLSSIWKFNFLKILYALHKQKNITETELLEGQKCLKPFLVPTGIKAYMKEDEFLMLANRSSSPLKRSLILPNGVGIIDADYYNNPNNEGEIFVQLVNFGLKDQLIKKGDRIGQGIFLPYLVADNDEGGKETRTGGFGSSGK